MYDARDTKSALPRELHYTPLSLSILTHLEILACITPAILANEPFYLPHYSGPKKTCV